MDDVWIATELAESHAWEDLYRAAPDDFRSQYALRAARVQDGLVLTSTGLHLAHFNSVIGLGTRAPVTAAGLEAILAGFAGAKFYIHAIAGAQPELERLLEERGLRVASEWDRVIRNGSPLPEGPRADVEEVTRETAAEWSAFIDRAFHLPTSPWLQALVGRAGWHHFLVREGGRIAAVRTLFIDDERNAWFGIEAPVPGIMTPNYGPDLALCEAMVRHGLRLGVRRFGADIEKPSPERLGPAYDGFRALGFSVPYRRRNFMPVAVG